MRTNAFCVLLKEHQCRRLWLISETEVVSAWLGSLWLKMRGSLSVTSAMIDFSWQTQGKTPAAQNWTSLALVVLSIFWFKMAFWMFWQAKDAFSSLHCLQHSNLDDVFISVMHVDSFAEKPCIDLGQLNVGCTQILYIKCTINITYAQKKTTDEPQPKGFPPKFLEVMGETQVLQKGRV